MKIGLIDPALRRAGHHVSFISYIYSMLRQEGINILVADFDNILRDNSEIQEKDLLPVCATLPTELFPIGEQSPLQKLKEEYRKYRFYGQLKQVFDDADVDFWLITTYDKYSLPLLYYSGLGKKRIVPLIHATKIFRKNSRRFYGLVSFWYPHLLLRNLSRSELVLFLVEEQKEALISTGFSGNTAYFPYNAVSLHEIETDNREKLSEIFRLCTISIVTEERDIYSVMRAVSMHPDMEYFVGGSVPEYMQNSSYVNRAKDMASKYENISVRFEYLSDEEYYNEIAMSHFAIVPINEKYQRGVQLTGLMVDCLMKKRPFIGPDIFPLNKFVNDYGVGLLYDPENFDSMVDTLLLAKEKGVGSFYDNICAFLSENSFEKTGKRLKGLFQRLL